MIYLIQIPRNNLNRYHYYESTSFPYFFCHFHNQRNPKHEINYEEINIENNKHRQSLSLYRLNII